MNWFKQAQEQEYQPIAIVSWIPSYGELGIVFNGGKKYTYYNVNDRVYKSIEFLLSKNNYKEVQKILTNLTNNM